MAVKGRFAPSPTGRMHAGNIFAYLMAWLCAHAQGGSIVLRVEDLDVERSRADYADQILRDFEFLGLTWDEGPYYQQGRDDFYREAFDELSRKGLVYPCFCTRVSLKALSAPHWGEKQVYPGICRNLSSGEVQELMAQRNPAWRLRVPDARYEFVDAVQGPYGQNLEDECGDFVIRRSDGLFAYQLASVLDDAEQGVDNVVRGVDLITSTPQQMYLQDVLGLSGCTYAHVPLIVSKPGRRLSKRDHDASLDELVSRFGSPEGVIGHIAFITGLVDTDEPCSCEELLERFEADTLSELFEDKIQIQWR